MMPRNPQMARLGANPLFQRAQQMAQGKNQQELMQIAKNICNEKGLNIDEAWNQFQNQMRGVM